MGSDMFRRILIGAAAGAAGTTALNAATYVDMACRARPASSTPEQLVDKLAASLEIEVPGESEARENRLSGLGALAGIATGVGVGAAYGALDVLHLRPPGPFGAIAAAAGAMIGSDVPMAKYGVSDPTTWSGTDWLSDAIPHLIYGAVVAMTYAAATRR